MDPYLFSTSNLEKKFKVNGHRLMPYLTSEPSILEDTVNLHLPQTHEDVRTVSPSPHQSS